MGYIQKSLGANETVQDIAHFHWSNYAFAYGALGLSIVIAVISYNPEYPAAMALPVAVGAFIFLAIMIPIWTTQIGVVNQRPIYKRGFIQRDTHEMQLRTIESVSLDQDVAGRLMGYGKLEVYGTGDEEIRLPAIGDPLAMRRALQEAIGNVQTLPAPGEAQPAPSAPGA